MLNTKRSRVAQPEFAEESGRGLGCYRRRNNGGEGWRRAGWSRFGLAGVAIPMSRFELPRQ